MGLGVLEVEFVLFRTLSDGDYGSPPYQAVRYEALTRTWGASCAEMAADGPATRIARARCASQPPSPVVATSSA